MATSIVHPVLVALFTMYILLYRRFIDPQPGWVIPFPFNCMLKVKKDDFGLEADTLRFVAASTTIPVPRVLASAVGDGYQYTLMRRIKGVTLRSVWSSLSTSQRDNIISQLHTFVEELRTLVPPSCVPPGAICSLYHKPFNDSRISSLPCGPFPSEREFNDFLVKEAGRWVWHTECPKIRAQMRDDHKIVFTHGDLTPRNIMVDVGRVAGIIDWEDSGWLPEHWEVVKALYWPAIEPSDWERAIERIVPGDHSKDWYVDRLITDQIQGAV